MLESADLNRAVTSACLVGVQRPDMELRRAEGLLDELQELCGNLDIATVQRHIVRIRQPTAALLLGSGKAESILAEAHSAGADCIIFDEPLSPRQQRNWEALGKQTLTVLDRQEIILDIFHRRAQTREARLQVQLARLEYDLPRMKRAWTHLDRQRGGGAVQRDAGETQLEMDQRMIRNRIARLKQELADVLRHRDTQRKRRMRVPMPTAAIVGYTNAGKSSLLNALADDAEVLAADKLFATLDPTTRRATLPNGQTLLLTDTVGFVRRLPHRLVDAFKATLEEAVVADFLIHVLDVSSPDVEQHAATTKAVLAELHLEDRPTLMAFNKIDRDTDPTLLAALQLDYPEAIRISARTGQGLDELRHRCETLITRFARALELVIPHDRYDLLNQLHQAGAVETSEARAEGTFVRGHIPERYLAATAPYQISDNSNLLPLQATNPNTTTDTASTPTPRKLA